MTTKQELLALAERAERGGDEGALWEIDEAIREWQGFGPLPAARKGWAKRYTTSLDAAKALHDAVLPGKDYRLGSFGAGENHWAVVFTGVDGEYVECRAAPTPAAAWVAAILRAKAEESE